MQPRPPPRWPPPAPWAPPPPRLGFVPPLPPPVRGFPRLPRFYPVPPRGFYPHFVRPPPPPRPPPPRLPVMDTEQQWLDTFKRTHCSSTEDAKSTGEGGAEPPLRALRRRVAKAQELVEQLKAAAAELAAVEKRLETLDEQQHGDKEAAVCVEAPRLRVQRERKLATCEALKKKLEAMNATSGLFPEQQLKQIRDFAVKVKKKKAYRKRAKLRRRAEASIRRAVNANVLQEVGSTISKENSEVKEVVEEKAILQPSHPEAVIAEPNASTYLSSTGRDLPKQSLDPGTLTIDALITVRRAWDSYIVFPQTPGASTIPPHFVTPPPAPSANWAAYVASSTASSVPR